MVPRLDALPRRIFGVALSKDFLHDGSQESLKFELVLFERLEHLFKVLGGEQVPDRSREHLLLLICSIVLLDEFLQEVGTFLGVTRGFCLVGLVRLIFASHQ